MKKMKTLTVNGVTYTVEDPDAAHIDDGKVSADVWSSKNTVDKLCPSFAKRGAVVTCEPVEGYSLDVVSHIELIQEGNGDPTPEILGDNIFNVGNACTVEVFDGQYMAAVHREYEVGVTYRFAVMSSITPNRITLTKGGDGWSETVYNTNVCEYTFDQKDYDLGEVMEIRVEWDDEAPDDYENCTLCPVMQKGNIRPIVGHTACKVWRGGKNLFDDVAFYRSHGFVLQEDGYWMLNNMSDTLIFDNAAGLPGQFTCQLKGYYPDSKHDGLIIKVTYTDGTVSWLHPVDIATTNASKTVSQIYWTRNTNQGISYVKDFQIEYGATATPYEPYRYETFTAELGQDVYGGSFDWNSGILTIDRKCITLDGTESWTDPGTGVAGIKRYRLSRHLNPTLMANIKLTANNEIPSAELVCSKLPTISANWGWFVRSDGVYAEDSTVINAVCAQYADDLEGFKEMVKGAQIVFGLETPITVQLSPQEILALSGENTIYSDTGDTAVSGKADPNAIIKAQQAVINSVLNRVTALEAAAVDNI